MKLPVMSGLQAIKLLSKTGFRQLGMEGSHVIMIKESGGRKFKPVVPMHREIAPGTLLSIIKQAGMSREEFMQLFEKHR